MKCCEQYAAALSAFVDGELSENEKEEVLSHVEHCQNCREYLSELMIVHTMFEEMPELDAPEGFSERVLERVHEEKRERSRHRRAWPRVLAACFALLVVTAAAWKLAPALAAGDCVVITPHEPHFAQSMLGTSSEWRWLYFDPERALFPAFGQLELSNFSHFYGENFHNLFSPSQQPELCRIIGRLIAVADNRDEPFRQPHILALLALFTIELHKIQATGRRYDNANTTLHQLSRVNLAVQYLVNHFREKVEIAKLAALCGLSPTHFRRVFLQATSKTPLDYLQHLRITMAMAELRSQGRYSISETALRCGYDSISSFNRQFKRITGQQPRQWQKEQQQTAEQKDRQFPPFILDKANQ